MTATTAKRPKAQRTTSDAKATPTPKSTAYGREVLRVLKEMQKLGHGNSVRGFPIAYLRSEVSA